MVHDSKKTDFFRLISANAFSAMGDSATSLAILLYISQKTGRAEPVVYLALIMAIPRIAALLIPGHLLDKLPKRFTLLTSEVINVVLTSLAIIAIFSDSYFWIFPVLFLKSTVTSIYNPVRSALLPSLIEEDKLMNAYSKLNTTNIIASVFGTAISGVLISVNGLYWTPLIVDIFSFVVSFLLFFKISRMPGEIEDEAIDWQSASSGLNTIKNNSILITALLFGISLTISLEFYNVLYVPLLSQVLKVPAYWFSVVETVQALAIVLSGFIVTQFFKESKEYQKTAIFSAIVLGFSVAAMGRVSDIYLFTLAIFFMGLAEIPLSSAIQTMIQAQLTDNIRVRVATSINGGVAAAEIVGLLLCLLLINFVSVSNIFVLSGCVILLISFIAFLSQRIPESKGVTR